jgi:hypothetical protein
MDERIRSAKPGTLVPNWDRLHRLPTNVCIAPNCADSATIFRISDSYMDVSDQSYHSRQVLAFGTLLCFLCLCLGPFCIKMSVPHASNSIDSIDPSIFSIGITIILIFGYMCFWFGRDEFFSLSRRLIRFDRKRKMIYAVRRRRFFSKNEAGDVVWEVPWSEETVFCIHMGKDNDGSHYHIRCYELDEHQKVVRSFAIGREWPIDSMESLLAQWNYWCRYMNLGPAGVPPPAVYLAEKESFAESFFFCMYEFGFSASAGTRLLFMPFILLETCARRLALMTCREVRWPAHLMAQWDGLEGQHNEPSNDTPVGWGATIRARLSGEYPTDPSLKIGGWNGLDAKANAALWAGNTDMRVQCQSRHA